MADTERLRAMLDNIIDDNGEEAQVDFHAYLQDKMQDILGSKVEVPDMPDKDAAETED